MAHRVWLSFTLFSDTRELTLPPRVSHSGLSVTWVYITSSTAKLKNLLSPQSPASCYPLVRAFPFPPAVLRLAITCLLLLATGQSFLEYPRDGSLREFVPWTCDPVQVLFVSMAHFLLFRGLKTSVTEKLGNTEQKREKTAKPHSWRGIVSWSPCCLSWGQVSPWTLLG